MPKILIVEDEELTALSLEIFCKNLNYNVLPSVNNYQDAMSSIHKNQPDLLICDIKIQGEKSGLDIAYDAQEKYATATIFLTAYYDEEILQKAKKVNFYGYIIKPYKEKELEATIRLALFQQDKRRKIKKRFVQINNYIFDTKTLKLYNDKEEIHLSKKSKKLLFYLSRNPKNVKTYQEIISFVYEDETTSIDTLRHLVQRTRDVTGKDSIKAIKNTGYQLNNI